jgi:hypothetical protein
MFTDRQGEFIFQSPVFSQYLKTKINTPNIKIIIKTNTINTKSFDFGAYLSKIWYTVNCNVMENKNDKSLN